MERRFEPEDDAGAPGAARRDGAGPRLAPDDVFNVLQSERRRLVLDYLSGRAGPVGLRDLTAAVVRRERDSDPEAVTKADRQRVYISLYQSHLPKLDELGVIRYDQSRGAIERLAPADELDPFIDWLRRGDRETVETPPSAADRDGSTTPLDSARGRDVAVAVGSFFVTAAVWGGLLDGTATEAALAGIINAGLLALATVVRRYR